MNTTELGNYEFSFLENCDPLQIPAILQTLELACSTQTEDLC